MNDTPEKKEPLVSKADFDPAFLQKITTGIFASTDEKRNRIWTNTKLFSFLHTDYAQIVSYFDEKQIKSVKIGKELGVDWKDWQSQKELTLIVFPISTMIDQSGLQTKALLKTMNIPRLREYYPVDVDTIEVHEKKDIITYLISKNIIVSTINPFCNTVTWGLFKSSLTRLSTAVRVRTEEEIWITALEKQWKVKAAENLKKEKEALKYVEQNIKSTESSLMTAIKQYNDIRLSIVDLEKRTIAVSDSIIHEFTNLKQLPIVKTLQIRDHIYVDIGTVHITALVTIGHEMKDGIKVPIRKPQKVLIGDMTFIIQGDDVKVTCTKQLYSERRQDDYIHPHAKPGSICFGEVRNNVIKLLAEYKFNDLVKLLYSWAFSYNERDCYVNIQEFYDRNIKEEKEKSVIITDEAMTFRSV